MQTSYYPTGQCLPSESRVTYDLGPAKCEVAGPAPGQWTAVDCNKLGLCQVNHPCECDAKSCHVTTHDYGPSFDLRLSGNTLKGEMTYNGVGNELEFTNEP